MVPTSPNRVVKDAEPKRKEKSTRVIKSSSAKELAKITNNETRGIENQNKGSSVHETNGVKGTSNCQSKPGSGKALARKIPVLSRSKSRKRSQERQKVQNDGNSVEKSNVAIIDEKHVEKSENSLQSETSGSSSNRALIRDKVIELNEVNTSTGSLKGNKDTKSIRSDGSLSGSMSEFVPERKASLQKMREARELKKILKDMDEKAEDEQETKRQDKIIRQLYEVIKETSPILFNDEIKDDGSGPWFLQPFQVKSSHTLSKIHNMQGIYDCIMQDMVQIWGDTISLIKLVKDRTITYMEQEKKVGDRDHLTLESEMLQLAVTYAVNYSKLKTDFLMHKLLKHCQLKELKKTELEQFMDSKLIADFYSDEDLETLAEAVHDLKMGMQREAEIH